MKMDMDPIVNTVINSGIGVGMAVLVVWHVWYTQTRQIPALLQTFESQMAKERDAATSRLSTEREISTIRHEDNLKQSAMMLTSIREVHHALRNVANTTSLLATKIDMMLGFRAQKEKEEEGAT